LSRRQKFLDVGARSAATTFRCVKLERQREPAICVPDLQPYFRLLQSTIRKMHLLR